MNISTLILPQKSTHKEPQTPLKEPLKLPLLGCLGLYWHPAVSASPLFAQPGSWHRAPEIRWSLGVNPIGTTKKTQNPGCACCGILLPNCSCRATWTPKVCKIIAPTLQAKTQKPLRNIRLGSRLAEHLRLSGAVQ